MKIRFSFFCLFLFVTICAAQTDKIKFSSVTVATGETPLTKGLTGTLILESKIRLVEITLNNDFGYSLYRWKDFPADPSVTFGLLHNAPWIGPRMDFSVGPISNVHWFGWVAGEPEAPDTEVNFLFSFQSVTMITWNVIGSYTLQHFMQDSPKHLATLNYTHSFNSDFSAQFGITYDLGSLRPLFGLSVTYKK